ncbi:MAG: type IV toxin-antitoxin system AbiEi family antitoxin domain-containing protein [Candidatus Marsarchaeota archaeon]|jgi:predicted transcriptional regulator of viral defense system|nr:type IV toxin-antitoxin system AbiEi family antitoxin domain-containing protein [Candidatus Marsarchaeota archaeon]
MNAKDFIDKLNDLHLGIFTDIDVLKLLNNSKGYCNLYLYRLVKRGYILRIKKGLYALKGSNKFEIAGSMMMNSYVTSLAALFYQGLINQDPNFIEVANIKYSKTERIENDFGIIFIRFRKLPQNAFFGYYKTNGNTSTFFIAEPEKAVIDMLFLHKDHLLSYVEDVIRENKVNINKVLKYAKISGKISVYREVIKIIEKYKIIIKQED